MTDLEKTKIFFNDLGIGYEEMQEIGGVRRIEVRYDNNKNRWNGYDANGFAFYFSEEGRLYVIGAWE